MHGGAFAAGHPMDAGANSNPAAGEDTDPDADQIVHNWQAALGPSGIVGFEVQYNQVQFSSYL